MKKLNPELQQELKQKFEKLKKELDDGSFKIDSLELLRLVNTPHPLAYQLSKHKKKKKL